jgi:hypothetical protein
MDSKEIDMAMRMQTPILYEGRRYDRISEYVSWYDRKGNRQLSAVLLDGRCAVRVAAEKVRPVEE